MAVIAMRDALNQALREEMARDQDVFIMGEDIAVFEGSYKVTLNLLKEFGPKRVIDTPIAEEGFIGAGIGAAMMGLRPVVEIMTINFILVAMDQVVNHAAKTHYMFGGEVRVPLTIRTPGGGGQQLTAQHSQSLEVMFAHVPGLKVEAPSTPYDAKGMLKAAIRDDNPVMFIENITLYNTRGERFMPAVHPLAELAPRDVVARAAHAEMQRTGADHVLLDITDRSAEWLAARFPQIYAQCQDAGLDMAHDRIPVSPAAHYTMGGVRTNTWGETTIAGLFAVGETACTGVHGANRLASNSLLETVVFAKRTVERLFEPGTYDPPPARSEGALSLLPSACNHGTPTAQQVRDLMWDRVGIVRNGTGLRAAAVQLAQWMAWLPEAHDRESHDLHAILVCARLATEAALRREESRGAHYREDFPETSEDWRRHLVFRMTNIAANTEHQGSGGEKERWREHAG